MKTKISICLATFNGEKFLKQQLDSIQNQTYTDWHLIIQDDCSSDKTIDILNTYKKSMNIKIYKNNINIGYRKNFESLIQKTNTDYIMICDQDDIWQVDKIEILMRNIGENSLVYSNSMLIDENSISLNKTLSKKLKNKFINSNSAINFLYDNCVSAHSVLFKKELLPFIKKFPKTIYFDNYIAATASSLNGVKYIHENLVLYRQHASNTLGNKKKNQDNIKKRIFSKVEKKDQEIEIITLKIKEMLKIKTLNNNELLFLNQLYIFNKEYYNSWFNIKMFLFLFKNRNIVFNITKKNAFYLSIKKSIGKKLYKIIPIL